MSTAGIDGLEKTAAAAGLGKIKKTEIAQHAHCVEGQAYSLSCTGCPALGLCNALLLCHMHLAPCGGHFRKWAGYPKISKEARKAISKASIEPV